MRGLRDLPHPQLTAIDRPRAPNRARLGAHRCDANKPAVLHHARKKTRPRAVLRRLVEGSEERIPRCESCADKETPETRPSSRGGTTRPRNESDSQTSPVTWPDGAACSCTARCAWRVLRAKAFGRLR